VGLLQGHCSGTQLASSLASIPPAPSGSRSMFPLFFSDIGGPGKLWVRAAVPPCRRLAPSSSGAGRHEAAAEFDLFYESKPSTNSSRALRAANFGPSPWQSSGSSRADRQESPLYWCPFSLVSSTPRDAGYFVFTVAGLYRSGVDRHAGVNRKRTHGVVPPDGQASIAMEHRGPIPPRFALAVGWRLDL